MDYCSGAFLFTPTELFRSLGGFSADFAPAYYEDADYCMTLWQNGLRVVYEPHAVIRHYESASSGGNDAAKSLWPSSRRSLLKNGALRWLHIIGRRQRMSRELVSQPIFVACASSISMTESLINI